MERPKEKKQSNGWLTQKWMNLASEESGAILEFHCANTNHFTPEVTHFAVLTLHSHHLCPGWEYPQSWCSYRYWELTSVRSDRVQLGVTLKIPLISSSWSMGTLGWYCFLCLHWRWKYLTACLWSCTITHQCWEAQINNRLQRHLKFIRIRIGVLIG